MIFLFISILFAKVSLGAYCIRLAGLEDKGSRARRYAYLQAILFFSDGLIVSIAIYYLSAHPSLH